VCQELNLDIKWEDKAYEGVHQATEDYLGEIFVKAYRLTKFRKAETLQVDDWNEALAQMTVVRQNAITHDKASEEKDKKDQEEEKQKEEEDDIDLNVNPEEEEEEKQKHCKLMVE
jgi:hypothetical protein